MKKVTLYYSRHSHKIDLPENDYKLLIKNWRDVGNRGYVTTVVTVRGTQYDIDLTKVELIETEGQNNT